MLDSHSVSLFEITYQIPIELEDRRENMCKIYLDWNENVCNGKSEVNIWVLSMDICIHSYLFDKIDKVEWI